MNENIEIQITSMLNKHDEQKTILTITLLESISEGVKEEKGRYTITLDKMYLDTADPKLLSEIAAKLDPILS